MSRLPPVPPASRPTRGPDARPKTSVDISHRVRHQLDLARRDAVDVTAEPVQGSLWILGVAGLAGAGLYWALQAIKHR